MLNQVEWQTSLRLTVTMDAIENARQIASQLHAERVASGCDPTKPYAFVKSEIENRELCLEDTKPGAALLDGGRAKYIPNEWLVLHERCESEFENAFLAAHELGHVVLGDGVDSDQSPAIEMDRSAEPPPDAEYRVVDYGRLQRREIQMDLFAREFLLPRHYVRELHVEQGLTASKIAELHGAPFEVVAQQLLDAVLLPPCVDDNEAVKVERPLNPQQKKAALHRGTALLVEAGPGTGKTQTLTSRVETLIAEGVDPRSILLLTFSNKAAAEMAERIGIKNRDASVAMWIGTFHAFGLDLVRRFFAELGLERDPRMIDRTEAVELLEDEFPSFGLTHYRNIYDPVKIIDKILTAISRAKDEVVGAAEYRQLSEAMLLRAVALSDSELQSDAEKCLEIADVYDAYERIKKSKGSIDFGDLVSLPVQLLETNPKIRSAIASTYQHVLVDEYQDVNRSSIRLLKAISNDGYNLWAVGDAKQSIYRFRGASSVNMNRFGVEDFPSGQRMPLELNYRSVPEITDAFSHFASTMATSVHSGDGKLNAKRESIGASMELRTVDRIEHQTCAIADAIDELRQQGYSYRDQAILCTGNEKLSKLAVELESVGVPVLFLGSLFERPEVKDLLSFLSLLTDRRAIGLLRIGRQSDFRMSLADVAATIETLKSANLEPGNWQTKIGTFESVSPEGRQTLEKISATIGGFDCSLPPWKILASVLFDRTRMAANFSSAETAKEQTSKIAIWQLMNFLKVQPAGKGLPVPRVLDRIRRLVRLGDDRDLRKLPEVAAGIDGVRLMTVHGSKGLEFPVVLFPGLNGGSLPKSFETPSCPTPDGMFEGASTDSRAASRTSHAEEQECLFFVALSRARDRLIGFAPTRKANNYNWPVSPFLARLGKHLVRNHVTPTTRTSDIFSDGQIPLRVDGPCVFSADQIGLYESCQRRFFYTHILHIGGRRSSTAFMLMHDCVRTICETIVAENVLKLSAKDLSERITASFRVVGLAKHGYASQFSKHAESLIRYFLSTRQTGQAVAPVQLSVSLGIDRLTFQPDDCFVDNNGKLMFRDVKTGVRYGKPDDLGPTVAMLAARQYRHDCEVEVLHLTDQETMPVTMTAKVQGNRSATLTQFLADIRSGQFNANPSERTCPGCPAFFVCGAVPEGELKKTY